jgi:hypothetical protein
VTPYASGAIDRGAAALLVSLIRLAGFEFNDNASASHLTADLLSHPDVQASLEAIVQRCEALTDAPNGLEIRHRLESLRDRWLKAALPREGGTRLEYQATARSGQGTTVSLLKAMEKFADDPFACLNSLRNVEPATNLIFTDYPPENDPERVPQPFIPR